jgi:hypothetical protein
MADTREAEKALREIWRMVAVAHRDNRKLTEDEMSNLMQLAAHGLGLDPISSTDT